MAQSVGGVGQALLCLGLMLAGLPVEWTVDTWRRAGSPRAHLVRWREGTRQAVRPPATVGTRPREAVAQGWVASRARATGS
jgi:hypothetical protein